MGYQDGVFCCVFRRWGKWRSSFLFFWILKTYLGETIRLCSIPRRPDTWDAKLTWAIKVLKGKRTSMLAILTLLGLLICITLGWKTLDGMITIKMEETNYCLKG